MNLWQLWLAASILLIILEVATPGFVFFFFGIAALLMSLLAAVAPNALAGHPFLQSILFTILSLAGIFFCRNALRKIFSGKKIGADYTMDSDFANKPATVVERIAPNAPGKVEFNGTNWRAVSNTTLEPGAAAIITAREELTLTVMGA